MRGSTEITHWGRTIIGSDNRLSPDFRQAIIWTNAGMLLICTLGTNVSEILGDIHTFPFKKMHLKTSVKCQPSCLDLNVLIASPNDVGRTPLPNELIMLEQILDYAWENKSIFATA